MSSDMNMEASLAQENIELRHSTPVQEHDITCVNLACEATERKHSNENAKSLTELTAPEFEHNVDKVGQKLEDASQVINFGNEGLIPNDAAERSFETEQAISTLDGDLVPGSLKDEISTDKQRDGAENVPSRQTEEGVVKIDLKDVDVKGIDAEQAMLESDHMLVPEGTNSEASVVNQNIADASAQNGLAESGIVDHNPVDAEQAKLEIAHEVVPESTEMKTSLGELKQSLVNDSDSCELKQLEPPSDNADGNPSQSGGKDGGTSQKSKKRKSSLGSVSASTRVLRSRVQDKSAVPKPTETEIVQVNCPDLEQPGLPTEDLTEKITATEDERKSTSEQLGVTTEEAALSKSLDSPQTPHNCNARQLGSQPVVEANFPKRSGGQGRKITKTSAKGKHKLTTSEENARVLRSRSQEKSKAPEPSNNAGVHTSANGEQKRKRKKKKRQNEKPVDEYSRIRKHLKYLLHRMSYEQNLIDAYGEGWKGQSVEKLKPEKELERAKSEILSCKMRIRDLFQRLDSSIAVGRFPETVYDSDGLIDSEDIYCAKCGSKDLPNDNDIILCDGACERGFHQFCLEPPLLKEQIPSDEEGWLCPGCDCKVDCIELLNDAQGTNLSIFKTWEKVFPEVAAAAAGNKLDENFELPSDDSDDNDYDPDCSDVDDKVQEDESTSDESDLYSASEDSDPVKDEHNLQLSSDDSEDDDYDPDAQDLDEQVKKESSTSDFSSDSDDFGVAFDDSQKDEHVSAPSDHTGTGEPLGGETPKCGLKEKQSSHELFSLSKQGPDVLESEPVSERRHVERLDYKKLYDAEYGDASTDSSDEEWFDAVDAPRKKMKNNTEEVASGSRDPSTQVRKETDDNGVKHEQETGTNTPKKKGRKKARAGGTHTSPAKGSSEPSSTRKQSQSKRLGEAVTQGLLKSFKENQYPDKTKKETLAKELGITVPQVTKWFENARWSFRHTSRMKASLDQCSPTTETPTKPGLPVVAQEGATIGEQTNTNAAVSINEPSTGESSKQKPSNLNSRKRRSLRGQQASDPSNEAEEPSLPTTDLPKAQDPPKGGRPRKARKSAA